MGIVLAAERPPMNYDETGALRVGDSRVLVDLVIRAFQAGATAEAIHQQYPSAALPDVYGVITYYLRHRPEIESYLAERAEAADELRRIIELRQGDQIGMRERLLKRQSEEAAN